LLRRTIVALTVAAIMAAMLAATVTPAFAAPSCEGGQFRASINADERGDRDKEVKHVGKLFACVLDVPPGHVE
jgi:hypothetical protein